MTTMRRYCFDGRTAQAHFPGIGRYASSLVGAMAAQLDPDEQLLVLRDPTRPLLFTPFDSDNPALRYLDLPLSPFSLRQQWVVPSVLRRHRVTVYHSPYLLMPLFLPAPAVVTIHDFIPLRFPQESTLKARWLFRLALYPALRRAARVIAVSRSTAEDLRRYAPSQLSKSIVCLEAAGEHFKPASDPAVAELKRRLSLPERYALYLGSNKPHKNLDRLIEAWQSLSLPVPLILAGVRIPVYRVPAGVGAMTSEAPVRILGECREQDLAVLYSGATLFVFPSLYEGFGLPVLEAMACGAPVACSDRSSLPEVAGQAAVYFDPTSPQNMAQVLQNVLTDEWRIDAMRSASLLRAATFSWRKAARETLSVYRELARGLSSGTPKRKR